MARRGHGGFGPWLESAAQLSHLSSGSIKSTWHIHTTTNGGASPTHSEAWIEKDSRTPPTPPRTRLGWATSELAKLARHWIVWGDFRVEGTLESGDDWEILRDFLDDDAGNANALFTKRQSNSTYRLELYDAESGGSLLDNTSELNTSQNYAIRMEAAGGVFKMHVDGVEEMNVSIAGAVFNFTLAAYGEDGPNGSDEYIYWAGVSYWSGDAGSDRPGTATRVYDLFPNGDDTTADYANAGGTNGDGSGSEAEWDEWESAQADDATTYNKNAAASADQEISTLSTKTITNVGNTQAVVRVRSRKGGSAKTDTDFDILLKDGGSVTEILTPAITQSWTPWAGAFSGVPGGGSWTQGIVDALKAGVQGNSGAGDDDWHTALNVDIITIDDDAEVTENRRRTMAQVV